jgi:hypothetical protein
MRIVYIILLLVSTFSFSQKIKYVNLKNGLNIREKPNSSSGIIGQLNYLEKIQVIKKIDEKWLKISCVERDSIFIGYVLDKYLINKKNESNMNEWTVHDFIVECSENYKLELEQLIEYEREQWQDVPNPLIVIYKGNDIGDYHHINFEDSEGKTYDFGFGQNDFRGISLFDKKELNDNPKYLNKSFKIFWKWKISSFPCCSGDYTIVKAYLPSIVKLEILKE